MHYNGDDNTERKKMYHDLINFAAQGMTENAQFLLAIAVGIFAILVISITVNSHDKITLLDNAIWRQSISIQIIGIILSIAYLALVLFGIQTYVSRRLYEGMVGYYLKKLNEEWYYDDLKEIAKENKLANWVVRKIWTNSPERKEMYKGT